MATRSGWHLSLVGAATCSLALCALVSARPSSAAEWNRPSNSIHAGATSVQFLTFGGTNRFPAFSSAGLYLKYHFSDRGALRVGSNFYLDELSAKNPKPPNTSTRDSRNYSVSVSAELEEYVDATGTVTIFLGVGPYWTRGRAFEQFYYLDTSSPYYTLSRYETKYWEVGGSAAVGFEWFFKRTLSLIGRGGASLGFGKNHGSNYRETNYPNVPIEDNHFEATTATAGSSATALGMAVHF
jgi:hypothetical protein